MAIYVYLRVSTQDQADSGDGYNAQLDACKKWAEERGKEIHFHWKECISGGTDLYKRPILQYIISFLSPHDILLVARRDRIGRGVMINATIDDAVRRRKAKLISVAGEGGEGNDPSSVMFREITDCFSGYERNLIKKRTSAVMSSKKARNERVGKIPFGKQLHADGVHLEDDSEELLVLVEMKRLRELDMSCRRVAEALNGKGMINRRLLWNVYSVYGALNRLDNKKTPEYAV